MAGEYKRPLYEELKDYTSKLFRHFNHNSRRYVPPSWDDLVKSCSSLETAYRTSKYYQASKNEVRLNQIACITMLCNNLVSDLSIDANEEKLTEAKDILLGAIYYRYYRLNEEYRSLSTATFGFFSARTRCALSVCLESILKLSELNQMDELSVHTFLVAYRQHLMRDDYYKKFDYIARHKTYIPQLISRIEQASVLSEPLRKQFKFIEFIKNLDTVSDELDAKVEEFISRLNTDLKRQARLLPDEGSISRTEIINRFDALKPDPRTRHTILGLITESDFMRANGAFHSVSSPKNDFKEALSQLYFVQKKMLLIGAYLVILHIANTPSQEKLFETVAKGLKLSPENKLDYQTKQIALKIFNAFLYGPSIAKVNLDVFGGRDMLERIVTIAFEETQAQMELTEFILLTPASSYDELMISTNPGPSCSSSTGYS